MIKNKNSQKIFHNSFYWLGIILIGIIFVFLLKSSSAWVEPSEVTSLLSPINSGVTSQTKTGGLLLNSLGATVGLTVEKGRTGIGTTGPQSILDISSTTKALLPPRMTTAQRDTMASPQFGMVIINTDTKKINLYNGSTWEMVTGGNVISDSKTIFSSSDARTGDYYCKKTTVLDDGKQGASVSINEGKNCGSDKKCRLGVCTPLVNCPPITLTSNSSPWTVPSSWNSEDNSIEAWGGGGGGSSSLSPGSLGGAGGGAYAKNINLNLIPGAIVLYNIGNGGAPAIGSGGASGGDTWLGDTSIILAKGGKGAPYDKVTWAGGDGGFASASVGNIVYSGGKGGGAPGCGGGGGGASASSNGNGGNGQDSILCPGGSGSSFNWAGGAGGISPGAGVGGVGGNGWNYVWGGQPGSNGASNSFGGGGGGGSGNGGSSTGQPGGSGASGGFPGGGGASSGGFGNYYSPPASGFGSSGQIVIKYRNTFCQ